MIRTLPTAGPLNGGLKPVAVRGLQDAPLSFFQGGQAPCFAKGGTQIGSSGSVDAAQATRGSGVLTLPGAGTTGKVPEAWSPVVPPQTRDQLSRQQQAAVELFKIALDLLVPQVFALDREEKRRVIGEFTTVLQTNAADEAAVLEYLRGFCVSNFAHITSDEQKWTGFADDLLKCSKFGDGDILASARPFQFDCQNFIINNLEAMTLQNFPWLKHDVDQFIKDKYSFIEQHLQSVYPMVLATMAHPSFRQDPVGCIESMIELRGPSEEGRIPMDIVLGFFIANSKKFELLKKPGSISDVTIEPVSAPWSQNQKNKASNLLYHFLAALDPLGVAREFKLSGIPLNDWARFEGYFLNGGVKTGQGDSAQAVIVVDSASFGDAANVLLGKALGKFSFGAESVHEFKKTIIRCLSATTRESWGAELDVGWQSYVAKLIDWFNVHKGPDYGNWLYRETEGYISSSLQQTVHEDCDKAYVTALIMTFWAKEGIKNRRQVQKLMREVAEVLPVGASYPFPFSELFTFLKDVSVTPAQGGKWERFAPPKGR